MKKKALSIVFMFFIILFVGCSSQVNINEPVEEEPEFTPFMFEKYLFTGKDIKEMHRNWGELYEIDTLLLQTAELLDISKKLSFNGYTSTKTAPLEVCKQGEEVGQSPDLRYCSLDLEKRVLNENGVITEIKKRKIDIVIIPTNKQITNMVWIEG
jgi:hypothetical protein